MVTDEPTRLHGRLSEPRKFIWDQRLREHDREFIDTLNESLEWLSGLRAVEISRSGHLAKSKIAWKLTWYQQVLLHRIVALVDATAVNWNNGCILGAMLSARAFMETFAIFAEFRTRVRELLASEDVAGLDFIAQHGLFATRDEQLVAERPEMKAKNILSYVEKFDQRVSGFAQQYDILSERCHPNSPGHTYMFSELDQGDATVRFTSERNPDQNRDIILGALAALPVVGPWIVDLCQLISKVADVQHRIASVGHRSKETD